MGREGAQSLPRGRRAPADAMEMEAVLGGGPAAGSTEGVELDSDGEEWIDATTGSETSTGSETAMHGDGSR